MSSGFAASAETSPPSALARRVAAGEREAEVELVARFRRGTGLLLRRHCRSAADAEDLLQETFRLAIVKLRAGELRDFAGLPGFIARLARNLAIEHYRKAGRRRTTAASDVLEEVVEAAAEPGAAGFPGPLGELLEREKAALVRQVITELGTDRDREVLYRFYIAEEERGAIADDLGLSGLQLSRVLHRARERYRALYVERARTAARGLALLALAGFAAAIFQALVPLLWERAGSR